MAEIRTAVSTGLRDAIRLIGEVSSLEAKDGMPQADARALKHTKSELDDKNDDNKILQTFFDQVDTNWQNGDKRRFGIVDWAPMISVRVDDCHYTRDIATFVIDAAKLVDFNNNIVDLGAFPFFLLCFLAPFHLPSFAVPLANIQLFR